MMTDHGVSKIKSEKLEKLLNKINAVVDIDSEKYYREIGIRSHGKGIFHKNPIQGKDLGNKRVLWVKPNCFVVNIVFAWEQAVAKTTKKELGFIASHRFPMYEVDNNTLDLDYLVYFFKTPRGKELLGIASPGGAGRNKTLGQMNFLNLSIPLPPLAEQKKIVQILSTWDKTIATVEELIEKKAILFQAKLNRIFSNSSWSSFSFQETFKIMSSKKYEIVKTDYLDQGKNPIVDQSQEFISGFTNNENLFTDIPVIIFGDHTRVIKYIDFPFKPAANGTKILRTTGKIDLRFAYFLLKFTRIDSLGYSRHMKVLKEKRYSYPISVQKQKDIAHSFDCFEREIKILIDKNELLKQQKKGLMQRLLTDRVGFNQ